MPVVKNLLANAGDGRDMGSVPGLVNAWQPTLVFFPGESHGQRSLAATVHGVTKNWTPLSDQRATKLSLRPGNSQQPGALLSCRDRNSVERLALSESPGQG